MMNDTVYAFISLSMMNDTVYVFLPRHRCKGYLFPPLCWMIRFMYFCLATGVKVIYFPLYAEWYGFMYFSLATHVVEVTISPSMLNDRLFFSLSMLNDRLFISTSMLNDTVYVFQPRHRCKGYSFSLRRWMIRTVDVFRPRRRWMINY